MSEERFEFVNGRGERLVGILHGELGTTAALSCHGMLSNKDGQKHVLLAQELAQRGVPSLRFDFAGRGESQGSMFDMTFSSQVEDLDAAINALGKRGVQRVAVFGSSMGGTVALLAAARDERIEGVATLAAVGHTESIEERHPHEAESWLSRGYIETPEGKIGRAFYDDALSHEVTQAVRILRIPLYIVHGEDDDVVPASDAHDIATAARQVMLDIVPGADHQFSQPTHLRVALRGIADFLALVLSD